MEEFTFVDDYRGKCHICKRGTRIDRMAYDVNHKGELCRVIAVRERNRERPGVITVGYTTCTNWRCPVHVSTGYRKVRDAKAILRAVRATAYSKKRKWKKHGSKRSNRRRSSE